MSLDFLAQLRAQGKQPVMVCVTTDADLAEHWANNAGIWPVVVRYGVDYDFAPLADLPVILALPRLKGPDAQRLAQELMAVTRVTGFDLEPNQTSVVVEA